MVFFAAEHPLRPRGVVGDASGCKHLVEVLKGGSSSSQLGAGALANEMLIH